MQSRGHVNKVTTQISTGGIYQTASGISSLHASSKKEERNTLLVTFVEGDLESERTSPAQWSTPDSNLSSLHASTEWLKCCPFLLKCQVRGFKLVCEKLVMLCKSDYYSATLRSCNVPSSKGKSPNLPVM